MPNLFLVTQQGERHEDHIPVGVFSSWQMVKCALDLDAEYDTFPSDERVNAAPISNDNENSIFEIVKDVDMWYQEVYNVFVIALDTTLART